MGKIVSSILGGGTPAQSISDPGAAAAWGIAKPTFEYLNPAAVDFTKSTLANPAYSGDRVASLNPFQTGAANTLGSFSGNFGNVGSTALTNTGLKTLGGLDQYGANASNLFNQFSGDPTKQILGTAASYADNPYVSGMIDAATRDVNRNLFEQQLPGINRSAVGAGGLNSSRAGVESAIATRGAADRMTDLASNIRGNLFNTGLTQGQNQYNQNLQNLLNTNAQLYTSGMGGVSTLGAGQDYATNAFNQGNLAGGLFRSQDQAELDANKAYFDEALANRSAALGNLAGIGGATKANTSAGVAQAGPSGASQLGGLALGAGSLLSGLGTAGILASDRRVKENIKLVGKLNSGLNVYTFEYKPEFKDKFGHGSFFGVMAQEALETRPEAVVTNEDGYMLVDYSKVV